MDRPVSTNASEIDQAFLAEFLDDYFAECDEHMTTVRRDVLALEPFVNQERVDQALLDELFRSFHTLKGLSGMVGVREAEELAHQMEGYLRALRQDQVTLTHEGLNALIAGTKTLEDVIAARRAEQPAPDISQVLSELSGIVPDTAHPAETAPPPAPPPVVEVVGLNPEEREKLAAALEAGARAWHFEFTPSQALTERGVNVNSIRTRLQEIGEVIHAEPRALKDGGIAFEFIVATPAHETAFAGWQEDGLAHTPYETDAPAPAAPPPDQVPPPATSPPPAPPLPAPTVSPALTMSNVVRVDLARLDELMRMVGELVTSRARLEENLKSLNGDVPARQMRALQETNLSLVRHLRDLREAVMRVRMVPIGEVFERMRFVIRDLARESEKQIALELGGQETEIDKFVVDRMMEPLLHLVRNAVSHGLEPADERLARGKPPEGKLALRASTAGDVVVIEIEDDGRGIDADKVASRSRKLGLISADASLDADTLLDVLCAPGFSTRDQADRASGRGMGMSSVQNTVLELGGSLSLDSQAGRGTRFTIQLPLTLMIVDALIVAVGGQTFAIPLPTVHEVVQVESTAVTAFENNEILSYRGGVLLLLRLARLFGLAEQFRRAPYALVVGNGSHPVGIVVDSILGQQEIVVRALSDPLVQAPGLAGATELGDGRVVLILDAAGLIRAARA